MARKGKVNRKRQGLISSDVANDAMNGICNNPNYGLESADTPEGASWGRFQAKLRGAADRLRR